MKTKGTANAAREAVWSRLNVGWLVAVFVPALILTPLYAYAEAVKQNPAKYHYPHATITQTACNYPQDVAFRFWMLLATSLLAFVYFAVFRWLAHCARAMDFPGGPSRGLFLLAEFSIVLYCLTIGTIDEAGTGPLHSPCAVAFFVVLLALIVDLTVLMTRMADWRAGWMRPWSLRLKQLLALYVVAVWLRCVLELALFPTKSDQFVVIIEWNTVVFCLGWVLSFAAEWHHLNVLLIGPHPRGSILVPPPQSYPLHAHALNPDWAVQSL